MRRICPLMKNSDLWIWLKFATYKEVFGVLYIYLRVELYIDHTYAMPVTLPAIFIFIPP